MRRRPPAVALGALACLTTLTAPAAAHAADAVRPPVRVIGDCVHPTREPSEVTIACADHGIFFQRLTYTSWTRRSATGRGQLWINDCTPDCADGRFAHHAVRFTMDRPVRVDHQLRFSRILVTYVHRHGAHRHGVEYVPTRPIP